MRPSLLLRAEPLYQSAMQREEDFQRTQIKVNVPLISVSLEFSTFRKQTFPSEFICLERQKPYRGFYYRKTHGEHRKDFDWNYLDELSSTVVSLDEFKENFSIFTMNQLKKLNWNNVFAAGGFNLIFYILIQ